MSAISKVRPITSIRRVCNLTATVCSLVTFGEVARLSFWVIEFLALCRKHINNYKDACYIKTSNKRSSVNALFSSVTTDCSSKSTLDSTMWWNIMPMNIKKSRIPNLPGVLQKFSRRNYVLSATKCRPSDTPSICQTPPRPVTRRESTSIVFSLNGYLVNIIRHGLH